MCGRHPESDVFLDDITVSRKHLEIRRADGQYSVHDQGSLNGTYVNGDLVEQTQLANGDEIQVGKFKLVFFSAPERTSIAAQAPWSCGGVRLPLGKHTLSMVRPGER